MTNVFRVLQANTSKFMLIAFPAAVLLVIISGILMIEDYRTSYAGYLRVPTLKVDNYLVPIAVALIPQAGQIVLFYMFARDTRNRWALSISVLLFAFDLYTDVTYKSGGDWNIVPVALVESVAIFTIGSEVMFSLMGGFLLETWPEFMVEFYNLLKSIGDGIGYVINSGDDRR